MLFTTCIYFGSGYKIDCVARSALWEVGLDYQHGTGHGVGAFLNVHEGPQGISYRTNAHEEGLRENMILSNEPGYYESGQFSCWRFDSRRELFFEDSLLFLTCLFSLFLTF